MVDLRPCVPRTTPGGASGRSSLVCELVYLKKMIEVSERSIRACNDRAIFTASKGNPTSRTEQGRSEPAFHVRTVHARRPPACRKAEFAGKRDLGDSVHRGHCTHCKGRPGTTAQGAEATGIHVPTVLRLKVQGHGVNRAGFLGGLSGWPCPVSSCALVPVCVCVLPSSSMRTRILMDHRPPQGPS